MIIVLIVTCTIVNGFILKVNERLNIDPTREGMASMCHVMLQDIDTLQIKSGKQGDSDEAQIEQIAIR
uniref:Putative secreted protein n=1 Tax=Anopheles triannulatus TaxID=58253 RepID=A0A2M4B477_9DIPT